MPKNIVLLSDGTGNSAAKLSKTNVWRFYDALDLSDPRKQIALYDDGVGTSSFKPLAIVGGAFGYGVKRNVLDLYTFLCRNYEDGDRIFLFGFSRGAFTVRAVAGLISFEGLVPATTEAMLQRDARTAYRTYRRERFPAAIPLDKVGRAIRDLFVGDKGYAERRRGHAAPPITFLGVWDTVAAYGLPTDEMTRALNWVWRLYPKDREAPSTFKRVCHAVAIDDERYTFHPMLFNEEHEPDSNTKSTNINDERITQVWFTGMHSNVGGGYPDDGLSFVSFEWMIKQAQTHEPTLQFDPDALERLHSHANFVGTLYDSRQGLGGLYRYMPRKIAELTNEVLDKGACVKIPRPKIHESVLKRIRNGSDHYAPIGLPATYAVVTGTGDIVDPSALLEERTHAHSRANQQESVWNVVWWKRVAYFTSIAVGCALAAFPLYLPAKAACESRWFCFAAPLVSVAGTFLPGFLSPWISAYKTYPGWFFLIFGLFVALLTVGKRLQVKIWDSMRELWSATIMAPEPLPAVAQPPSDLLFRIRTHPLYRFLFQAMKRHLLPAAFALAALVLLAGVTSQLAFSVFNSAGLVCGSENGSGTGMFPTSAPCWATGYTVAQGKTYRIKLNINDDFKDASIPAGLGGFSLNDMPLYFQLLQPAVVPFRRHIFEAWYRPVARIGSRGSDEYVLKPRDGSTADSKTREMTAQITARRSGALFLFVNDAVLPVTNQDWQWFYRNNTGQAAMELFEVDADGSQTKVEPRSPTPVARTR